MITTLLVLVFLIALSALFSASETALFSIPEARVSGFVEQRRPGAPALAKLRANRERLRTTILVGKSIANVMAASLATVLALDLFGRQGVAYAVGAVTLLVLVFAEIAPKGLASAHAEGTGLLVAPPLRLLSLVLLPLVLPLAALTRWFGRRGRRDIPRTVTEGEIRELTTVGHREGSIDEHERRIIERAFWLDETRAWDIMTPRVDVFAWPASRSLSTIAHELSTVRYSRIPVYRDSIDDVIGVLHTRDAYQALVAGQRDIPLSALAREPFFVPGSIPLTRLLGDFQTRRIHLGVVIDEYGGTDGLVTLEDILEELVGEITDERDLEHQPIVRLSRSEILVEGQADLREVNHFFNSTFPHLEHRSMNGYLLDEVGYVPRVGERFEREGVVIHIVDATETQVLRARLVRAANQEEPAGRGQPGDGRKG